MKKFSDFLFESEYSLPCSVRPVIGLNHKPPKFSRQSIFCFFRTNFNIIFPWRSLAFTIECWATFPCILIFKFLQLPTQSSFKSPVYVYIHDYKCACPWRSGHLYLQAEHNAGGICRISAKLLLCLNTTSRRGIRGMEVKIRILNFGNTRRWTVYFTLLSKHSEKLK
jgi:hypothetical protein